jgi:hypothetical protein
MASAGIDQLLGLSSTQGGSPLNIVSGYVSLQKPAPTHFDDPAWIVIPAHSTEVSLPMYFPASHGATLPERGTPVLVAYDENSTPWLIAWQGVYSAT